MRKELFSELSKSITEVRIAQMELTKYEDARDALKTEMLQSLLDEVNDEGDFKQLLWKFAVDRNFGMDVVFDEIPVEKTIQYIKAYVKEIYCYNLDSISLWETDDEMEGDE